MPDPYFDDQVHNEGFPVIAMRVHNPDRSPVGINR
jgi:hypothetical protein